MESKTKEPDGKDSKPFRHIDLGCRGEDWIEAPRQVTGISGLGHLARLDSFFFTGIHASKVRFSDLLEPLFGSAAQIWRTQGSSCIQQPP